MLSTPLSGDDLDAVNKVRNADADFFFFRAFGSRGPIGCLDYHYMGNSSICVFTLYCLSSLPPATEARQESKDLLLWPLSPSTAPSTQDNNASLPKGAKFFLAHLWEDTPQV